MLVRWSVCWGNPYTKPPDGQPETLISGVYQVESTRQIPPEIRAAHKIGSGYAIYCTVLPDKPRRQLSLETKQRIRRKRLRKRLETRYPLFAETFYEEAVTQKPEYYGKES
jgi:hypothetical protein